MNKVTLMLMINVICTYNSCFSQKNYKYTDNEEKCINIFSGFINYLKTGINNKTDITDSSQIKHLIINYLFVNKALDTTDAHLKYNELTKEQLNNLKREVQTFYGFLLEDKNMAVIENLTAIPLRLSSDTFIYNRLADFQKDNTFAFYDKRNPKHTLGYVLFIPPIKNVVSDARIWSWTLMYRFGKYMFKSVTGEEGYEYIFSTDH